MTDMTPEEIARKLTAGQKRVVCFLGSEWMAGPQLPRHIINCLSELCAADLVEREFMDEGPAAVTVGDGEFSVKLSACWHFHLTPLGLRVRAILEKEPNHE